MVDAVREMGKLVLEKKAEAAVQLFEAGQFIAFPAGSGDMDKSPTTYCICDFGRLLNERVACLSSSSARRDAGLDDLRIQGR